LKAVSLSQFGGAEKSGVAEVEERSKFEIVVVVWDEAGVEA
jgi:hypothetical protein